LRIPPEPIYYRAILLWLKPILRHDLSNFSSLWMIKQGFKIPTVRMPVIYTQDDRNLSTMFHELLFM
jgi:hypothetical protein